MSHLVEPEVRSYVAHTLRQCAENRNRYYTAVVNSAAFLGLMVLIAAVLYYKKKTKLGPEERKKKFEEDRIAILHAMRTMEFTRTPPLGRS